MKFSPSNPLDRMTPEELAARSQHGSAEAFERLVGIFEARLYNFLLRRVRSRSDAEDLTQESFLRAWQRIGSYRSKWRFSTWLYTIATRLAISHARRDRGSERLGDGDQRAAGGEGGVNEGGSRVWRLVDEKLTEEQRTAVWLRYVEDMGIGEIGLVMGKSDVAVRVMLFRSRAILAEHLTEVDEVVTKLGVENQKVTEHAAERVEETESQKDEGPRKEVEVKSGRRVAGGVR